MQKLQLSYVTWQRPEANQLFDYQSSIVEPSRKVLIQDSGFLYRNQNTYHFVFVPGQCKSHINKLNNYHPILNILKKPGHFLIQSVKTSNQPLFKIITSQKSGLHKIKVSDSLRLGKVQIQVVEVGFKERKFKCHYQQVKTHMKSIGMSKIIQITPSFYEKTDESPSLIDDNPSCRYCHSKTIIKGNNFMVSCNCNGYTGYVHEECLMEWVSKRGNLCQIKDKGIFYVQSKLFKCQLCKDFYHILAMFKKIHQYQTKILNIQMQPMFEETLILHFKYQNDFLFFIDLTKSRQLSIGRSLESEIVLNQLSVSRKHAFLNIDYENKTISLKNNDSKFGTLLQIKKTQIQNNQTYQVGRSKISFKKHKKITFFERLGGFCFINQNLRKQKKKSLLQLN